MSRLVTLSLALAALVLAPAAFAQNPHGALGQRCDETADCDDPELECVTVDSKRMAGAGPAGGLCTRVCQVDADCQGWDENARCYRHDDLSTAFCFESCTRNDFSSLQLPEDRCHGRDDMACAAAELGLSRALCWPMCTSDDQCGDQYCNKDFGGLCHEEPRTGEVFASECDHTVVPTTCDGFCSWYSNEMGQCSELCIIGTPGACGAVDGEKAEAACLGSFNGGGRGLGDLGSCLELCSCDADCSTPGWLCRTSSLAGAYGARGTCYPADYVPQSIPECVVPPEDLGACVYGELRACRGESGCLGTATCNEDRSAYLDCVCTDDSGQGGQGGDSGSPGASGEPGFPGNGGAPGSDAGGPAAAGERSEANRHGVAPESGCGCRVARGSFGVAASWLLGLLGALLLWRRGSAPQR